MNFTLHLTENCNMSCTYCIREKKDCVMSLETVKAACDLAFAYGKSAGLCFFGGEPLLERDKIYFALDYCKELSKKTGKPFYCKMTTNGTLLDKEFIDRAVKVNMGIGVSFDGTAQKISRHYYDGSDSLADLERVSRELLASMPSPYAMMTLDPKAVHIFAQSIEYLLGLGYKKITATPAYGKRVQWTESHLKMLEQELYKIADIYESRYKKGEKIFFSPFDSKIIDNIKGENPSERCHLGMRQMPVSTDGRIYACTQFIGDEDYCFGDVFSGIDFGKCVAAARKASEPVECIECELKTRCTNTCGCMNRMETGDENRVSPMQCAYERMLIKISDELADRLFDYDGDRFIKTYANVK